MLKEKKSNEIIIRINEFIKNIDNKRKNVKITKELINDNINIIAINEEEAEALRE